MKSTAMAVVIGATMMIGAPVLAQSAAAQPASASTSSGYVVPVVVGAAAGATVGALLWPAIMPAGAAMAAPAAMATASWGWASFLTTRAVIGAIIGGGLGYVAAR
jgi:hypothetical protein